MDLPSLFYRQIWPVDTGIPLIRLGGTKDGSYLVPNVIDGIQLCLSPGTCGMIDFERALSEAYGIPCLLCDPAENAPELLPPLLKFDRIALASVDGSDSKCISSWMHSHGYGDAYPLLLSMDIEGGEIDVILGMQEDLLSRIRIATIEFHYLHLLHQDPTSAYSSGVLQSINKLCSHMDIVHLKPNNNCPFEIRSVGKATSILYTCIELTFLSKQLRKHSPVLIKPGELPHHLDLSNVSYKPEVNYAAYEAFMPN
jgi:hypothetical protein